MEPEKKLLQCKKCRHGYLEGQYHNCKFTSLYYRDRPARQLKVCRHCDAEVIRTRDEPKGYICEICRKQKHSDRNKIRRKAMTLAEFKEKWYTESHYQ